MKILQISPQIPLPESDGGKKSIFGITKALAARGHQVHFVAYRKNTDVDNIYDTLSKYCKPYILDVQTENSFSGALINFFSSVPYNVSKFHQKELVNFVRTFFAENEVDIVQVHNVHMAWIIDEIRKYTSAPIILRQENAESMIMKRFYEKENNYLLKAFAWMQYRKFQKYEPYECLKFDNCVMISERDKEILHNFDSRIKLSVIPSGVDKDIFQKSKKTPVPYSIAHIGQINWLPNFDSLKWLINSILPELIKLEPRIKLFVYGGGDYSTLRIPDSVKNNIEIIGYVDDIWDALSDKQLLAIPLRIGSGIRIKILDMLAFGMPVITTSVGKEGINVIDRQELLIADTKEEFVSKTINFFQNKYDVRIMTEKGRDFVRENYLWEVVIEKFESLYLSLINQKNL